MRRQGPLRFDDRDGSGSYYCNQCGPGPGIMLVRKLHGWDHATACGEIDRLIGKDAPARLQARPSTAEGSRVSGIKRALDEARQPEVVDRYLTHRGLSVSSPVLRGSARCPYYDDARQLIGRFPAVVAPSPVLVANCKARNASMTRTSFPEEDAATGQHDPRRRRSPP